MGRQTRQTRQTRRAQQRRQGTQRARHTPNSGTNWSLIGGGAIIAAAILLFIAFAIHGSTNSNGAANSTPATIPPGPTIAGIGCDNGMIGSMTHIHAHLTVLVRGKEQVIPASFGHYINRDCLFWMHAHNDANGVIHMESPHPIHPTLADWRKIALLTIPKKDVPSFKPMPGLQEKVWVNLKPYTGDPTQIKLYQHTMITVEYGPPFSAPKKFNFAKYQL